MHCSAQIMQYLSSADRRVWTSAHHMNTIVFISTNEYNSEEVKDFTDTQTCLYD